MKIYFHPLSSKNLFSLTQPNVFSSKINVAELSVLYTTKPVDQRFKDFLRNNKVQDLAYTNYHLN